jgi:FkbM family methyltransferase
MKRNSMMRKFKEFIKERVSDRLNIPYSSSGLPISLVKHLKKGQPINLVDVGSYNGDFTEALAGYCGISRGLLIDPLPHKVANLRQRFHPPTYQVFECAVSASNGTIEFEVNETEVTSSILSIRKEMPELGDISLGVNKRIKCDTRTLDNIVKEANIDAIDILKIDVQGAEHLVLMGAKEVLKKTSMIWSEVSFKALYEASSRFMDIYDMLLPFGFKLIEIEPGFRGPDGEMIQGDALFINTSRRSI